MIQVLQRALSILEFIAVAPQPCSLGEIAAHSAISTTTCANIVKELLQNGYLEQEGRGKGYRPGPMTLGLSVLAGPYAALRYAAEPVTQRLAEESGETAIVSVLSGTRKLAVCYTEGSDTIRFALARGVFDDIHWTATGHLLLAHAPDTQRKWIYQSLQKRWGTNPEAAPFLAALPEAEQKAKTAEYVLCDTPKVLQIAAPLRAGGRVIAGLGSYIPKFRADKAHTQNVIRSLLDGAREITAALESGFGIAAITGEDKRKK